MRRRWRWPILEFLRDALRDADENLWTIAALVWFDWTIINFFILIFPALVVDTNSSGVYLGTYLFVALIVFSILSLGPLLVVAGVYVWKLLAKYGPKLIPHRVTEPVHEDLRSIRD